jgi:hypothetical protein
VTAEYSKQRGSLNQIGQTNSPQFQEVKMAIGNEFTPKRSSAKLMYSRKN